MLNGNRVNAIRARRRLGWSIRWIARTFDVSRNTVRRYTRQGSPSCGPPKETGAPDAHEELDLLRRIVRRWNTPDHDELESALIAKLPELYLKKADADNWWAYLWNALNNAASNWIRARGRYEDHVTALERVPPSEDRHKRSIDAMFDVDFGEGVPVDRMRQALTASLRHIWDALIATNFDQTRAAELLGMHRNTFRKRLREIRTELMRRGFGPGTGLM